MARACRFAVVFLMAAAATPAAPATAQEVNPLVRERIAVSVGERRDTAVRVNVGINFFLPGPTGEGDEANKLRERARRMIYEMAAGECQVVEQVIARSCRLESISVNVNSNRQQMPQQPEGFMASGNFSLQVVMK